MTSGLPSATKLTVTGQPKRLVKHGKLSRPNAGKILCRSEVRVIMACMGRTLVVGLTTYIYSPPEPSNYTMIVTSSGKKVGPIRIPPKKLVKPKASPSMKDTMKMLEHEHLMQQASVRMKEVPQPVATSSPASSSYASAVMSPSVFRCFA